MRPLAQPRAGYRFSVDALLLADFATTPRRAKACLDLGTGSGVIALRLLERGACAIATGIEQQAELARYARENAAAADRTESFRIVTGDLRRIRDHVEPGTFDLIVANPPFHQPSRGRPSPRPGRAAARHEGETNLGHFAAAARHALGRGGRFCLVLAAGRLLDLAPTLRLHGLEPKRLRFVHPRAAGPARLLLCEARAAKPGGLVIEAPLTLVHR